MKEIKYCPYCGSKLPKSECKDCGQHPEIKTTKLKFYFTCPHHNDVCSTYTAYEPISLYNPSLDEYKGQPQLREEGIYLAGMLFAIPHTGLWLGEMIITIPDFSILPNKHRLSIPVMLTQEQRDYAKSKVFLAKYTTTVSFWPGKNKDATKYHKEILEALLQDIRCTKLKSLKTIELKD